MFHARFSPDGTKVAVDWNRGSPGPGLWVISLEDGSQTWSAPRHLLEHPLGWSLDGERIYTVDREGTIRRYPAGGGEGTIVPQPPRRETPGASPMNALTASSGFVRRRR